MTRIKVETQFRLKSICFNLTQGGEYGKFCIKWSKSRPPNPDKYHKLLKRWTDLWVLYTKMTKNS